MGVFEQIRDPEIPITLRPHFYSIIRVFCPKAGSSLQAGKHRLQFCRGQVFHRKLRNQGYSFTRNLIGAVASHYFLHPTFSLASEQTLKDLKRSQGHQRGGEESGLLLAGPSGLHRNSPQGLNIRTCAIILNMDFTINKLFCP